ncbi:hypothetical protein LIER_25184 [Lithospermum erythrorhizon]|uniref:RanBP2-type domain-containing protein n=1 Tax=Lithospermum erythrorhizon TaxID=34254 RepID=A0AAV3R704_LITER
MSQMLRHLQQTCPNLVTILGHKHNYRTNPAIEFILEEVNSRSPPPTSSSSFQSNEKDEPIIDLPNELPIKVEMSHPWPEWSALMDKLFKTGYFQENNELGTKDVHFIRTACLNFARDRYDLIRYLSPKHIFVIAGSGCPSIDRKIVNSGKRLRAHFNIDEGNVCGSCILRGNCERAFLRAPDCEGGRTVDVMRFLVAYGLDPLTGSVENMPTLKKVVKESAKILLKEMVEFSSETVDSQPINTAAFGTKLNVQESSQGQTDVQTKQSDWNCPKCHFMNFARNIRCLRCDHLSEEKLKMLREEEENLPQKKGDWICEKCSFLNFAKNSRCLRCKEKPPKRDLVAGEWECDSCNYINFRKNMVCLKCDHKRPKSKNHLSKNSQPTSNNMGYRRTRPIFGEEMHSKEDEDTIWEYVGRENDTNKHSNSWNQIPAFEDFPILGGKSHLSRDVQRQERWKREMELSRKNAKKDRENAENFKRSILNKDVDPFHCSDDEEMADWFPNRT